MKALFPFIKKKILRVLAAQNPVSRNAVKLKRAYRMSILQNSNEKILEIGGGARPLSKHYINVDIMDYPTVDVVADILKPLPFGKDSIGRIISVATLEHFNIIDLKVILKEFYRLLKSGGILEIGVPSLEKIIYYYQNHGCDDIFLRYLHGALKDNNDIHLCVVDFKRFKEELEEAGFIHIEEMDYEFQRHDKTMMMKIQAKK